MKKKNIVRKNIYKIGNILMHMVGAPGIKKETGVTRRESAALAHGLGIGLGLGYLMMNDEDMYDHVKSEKEAMLIASNIMAKAIPDFAKDCDRLLSLDAKSEGIKIINVESEYEGE